MIATVTALGWQKLTGIYTTGSGATYVTTVTPGTAVIRAFQVRRRPISGVAADIVAQGGNSGTASVVITAQEDCELEVWADVRTVGTITITQTSSGGTVNPTEASYAFDSSGNVIGLVGPSGGVVNLPPQVKATAQPWLAGFWGDSRYNSALTPSGADVIGSGVGCTAYRAPPWICGFLGDVEYSRTYAVSGDVAANWQSASRTSGRTFTDLNTSNAEVVFIQYGVNDAIAGTAAATLAGYLQNLIAEIFKSGKLVVFESIMPVASPASNFAAAQVIIDATNALMQTWLANFPSQSIYVDTATFLKAGGTYASATYMAAVDGLHPTRLGAYSVGKIVAAAVRAFLPKRGALFYGPASPSSNICNQTSPSPIATQFNTSNASGTATVVQSQGQDSNGYYYQWLVTPLTLAGGYQEVLLQMSANFQTTNPPYHALVGNEILQGSCRVVIDDGASGAPNIYNHTVRQRFYTAAIFADTGNSGAVTATDSNYTEKLDIQVETPKLANTAASVVASPAISAGYALQLLVDSQVTGTQYRVRVYNPQLRRVGYTNAAATPAVGASPVSYTNATDGIVQYFVSGGTVSIIALNTVATGLISGSFMLDPGDVLTITYSVVPVVITKQLLTQPSLRGLV